MPWKKRDCHVRTDVFSDMNGSGPFPVFFESLESLFF
jgi:hypothetical protein